jgi:repressor LexA
MKLMMQELPEKQRQILDFIRTRHFRTGIFPTIREIAVHMNFKSTNTVDYYLRRLETAGALERGGRLARTFTIPEAHKRGKLPASQLENGIPLVGRVAAGAPILAEQNYDGLVNFKNLFHCDERTYALKVVGDSMVDAGIVDGDLVVVRQQPDVSNGEIGVAVIGDEATVKRIFDEGDQWRLQPENPAMEPILVPKSRKDFLVAGKVIGVVRKI